MADLVRVNTRISSKTNEWLDNHSKETGLPKSVIVMLALEDYMKQKDVMDNMENLNALMEKIQKLEKQIDG